MWRLNCRSAKTVILLQKTVRLQHLEVSRQNRTCTERNRHCFESLVSHCNISRILFFSLTLHWLWFSFYRYSKRTVEMSYNRSNKAYIRPKKKDKLNGLSYKVHWLVSASWRPACVGSIFNHKGDNQINQGRQLTTELHRFRQFICTVLIISSLWFKNIKICTDVYVWWLYGRKRWFDNVWLRFEGW